MSRNHIIGDGTKLLWKLPGDLQRLKKMTMGNPLIMGRKTFKSIGIPLPGRANIVLTRQKNYKSKGVIVANDFNEAIKMANLWIKNNFLKRERDCKKIFIFGGGEVYNLFLNYCEIIELTLYRGTVIHMILCRMYQYLPWQ